MAGEVDYFEIGSRDPEASRRLFGGLFDRTGGEPTPAASAMVQDDRGGLWDSRGVGGGARARAGE